MDRNTFWTHVDAAKDADDRARALAERLRTLPAEEIVSFQAHFDACVDQAYRWDLWAAIYTIDGGCSDDGFTDARYGLISRGRAAFEAAMEDPDSLVDLGLEAAVRSLEDELYGYVALEVWEATQDDEMPRGRSTVGLEPAGEAFDFEAPAQLRKRLPRIAAAYGAA